EKPGKKAEKRVVRFTRAARWRDRETWNARRLLLIPMPFASVLQFRQQVAGGVVTGPVFEARPQYGPGAGTVVAGQVHECKIEVNRSRVRAVGQGPAQVAFGVVRPT